MMRRAIEPYPVRRGVDFAFVLALAASGCGTGGAEPNPRHAAPAPQPSRPSHVETIAQDLGTILTRGQTLRHEFAFPNRSAVPIRILKLDALTPCCSDVEMPAGAAIEPGGTGKVSVSFRPGWQSGRKRVEFRAVTDSVLVPDLLFALDVVLVPEWEIQSVETSGRQIPVGGAATQTFRVISRRAAPGGRPSPDRLSSSPAVEARFLGPPQDRARADGIHESVREIEVAIRPVRDVGLHEEQVAIVWPDGDRKSFLVAYETTARLRISPASYVLSRSEGATTRSAVLTSTDRPFRVLRARGAMLQGPGSIPTRAELRHVVTLAIDPGRASGPGVSDVTIETDHPDQPEITLSLVVTPGPGKDQR